MYSHREFQYSYTKLFYEHNSLCSWDEATFKYSENHFKDYYLNADYKDETLNYDLCSDCICNNGNCQIMPNNNIFELDYWGHNSQVRYCPNCVKCSFCVKFEEMYDFKIIKFLLISRHIDTFTFKFPLELVYLKMDFFNDELINPIFPETLQTLEMEKYNKPLHPNILPKSLIILILLSYNQDLNENTLPPNLYYLVLNSFNKSLPKLPDSIIHLYMQEYNRPLNLNVLPINLAKLHIKNYNHPLYKNVLPNSLMYLRMENYNYSVKDVLPSNLIYLSMQSFTQKLEQNDLPFKLTHLSIKKYNEILDENVLPPELIYLNLNNYEHQFNYNVLPSSLKVLCINKYKHKITNGILPDELVYLSLHQMEIKINDLYNFPHNLEKLEFKFNADSFNSLRLTLKKHNLYINGIVEADIHFLYILFSNKLILYKTQFLTLLLCCYKKKKKNTDSTIKKTIVSLPPELYNFILYEFFGLL